MLKQGASQQAALLFKQVVDQEPHNLPAVLQLARILTQHRQWQQARSVLENSCSHADSNFEFWHMLGALQLQCGAPQKALESINIAVQLNSSAIATLNVKGNILLELAKFEEAIETFQQAISLDANKVDPHNNIAWAYRAIGNKEQAIFHFAEAYRLDPQVTEALSGVLLLKTYSSEDTVDLEEAEQRLKEKDLPLPKRVELHFALGKAYEDCKQYEEAFGHFSSGNGLWRQTYHYDIQRDAELFEQLKTQFQTTSLNTSSEGSPIPIFVLGMPRSSTSLVEQILASHSKVFGAGELGLLDQLVAAGKSFEWSQDKAVKVRKRYLDGLSSHARGHQYVIDKMPQNFRYTGIILQCFPEAKIVHCQRDPRDNCLSLYKHHFPMANHPYAYKEDELASYHSLYQDLMNFWNEQAPEKILNLSYESLVGDFDSELSRLLDYVGLEFEPACKDFSQTRRAIRTASSDQVRRGLYTSGKEQWRHYEAYLGELFSQLINAQAGSPD